MSRPLFPLILLAVACAPAATPIDPTPSWHRDALPIVQARCQGCHVAGGIAPFALTSYADAEAHRDAIAAAVSTRRMPPWMPSDSCGQEYKDSKRLTDDEIATLTGWADHGIEGKTSDEPPAVKPQALPWTDKTLDPGFSYTPFENRIDDYRCFILKTDLATNRDLIGFEIIPGVRKQVHHVLLYSIPELEAQQLDDASAGPGWECFGGPGTAQPKTVGGWAPGTPVTRFPPNTGVTLYGGDVIVMQVHYNMANGAPEPDRTTVNFMYAPTEVPLHAQMFPLVQKKFAIPPNATGYSAVDEEIVPVPVTLWGVLPHMHTKGVTINVSFVPPAGEASKTCLVDIPKWDFHWQQFYFFSARGGQPMPADSKLRLTCSWNNPTSKTVTWGEGTDDEMCLAFIYVTSGQ